MLERGRRATDLQTPERRSTGARDMSGTCLEEGVESFPVFSEPPFTSWCQRHRRIDYLRNRRGLPLILLWDENGAGPIWRGPAAHGAQHPPG
ncbi:hypothetical protein [Pseudomonas sp.]|uniref:hypothetical protein n=1 Tax=Pseudomonas sp. TaxID=306 RepID=UPI002733F0ED|nr:hypothetical protein [Pseudomonas sp.]MDP3813854.1 hypothetical protein [Pseudomonas sp.]